jgi:lipopolysaccharide export system protein LptA
MHRFLRYCVGLTLLIYQPQLPLLAVELPRVESSQIVPSDHVTKLAKKPPKIASKANAYLITQERQGGTREFKIPAAQTTRSENQTIPIDQIEVVEIIADRQEYNEQTQVVTAVGNVVMRFAQSVTTSDRLEVNLADRIAVAQGNVVLKRGEQVLRGEKFEYYLVADRGVIFNAGGEIYQPRLSQDTNVSRELPPEPTIVDPALSDRLAGNQPLTSVTASAGLGATIGSSRDFNISNSNNQTGGSINRVRFEAERVDFEATTWQAVNFRLTNDPFSPPELELRSNTATFKQVNSTRSKLTTSKPRLVLDDSLAVPLFGVPFVFSSDRSSGQPGLFNIAFDGEERGGLYIERSFKIINGEKVNWEITPQYFLERALFPTVFRFSKAEEGGLFDPAVFGLKSRFKTIFTARTDLEANFSLTSFDTNDLEDNFRAKLGVRQLVGKIDNPYTFALEYNYRDRLFNGSLGFQTVFNSIGGVVTSPNIALGKTGVNLRYQGSVQNINSDTDRTELLESGRDNDRINLTRYQTAIFLDKTFPIWSGKALPATKHQGLRYTPIPVVPNLEIFTGISNVNSVYSNSDTQLSIEGSIGIQGQLGHFSRSWLDYTGFRVGYSQKIRGDQSPFLFDRIVDRQTLDLGIIQQIYGPIRLGFQTSLDLNSNDEISTDYLVEYSRRTYNLTLRYNPVLEIGSFSFRLSDFNWRGDPEPFGN